MSVLPKNISTYGGDIDFVFWLVTALVGFWYLLTLGAILYYTFRYRASKNPRATYVAGESWKESKYIEVPHLLVLVCDVAIIAYTFIAWNKVEIDIPEPDVEVGIEGKIWQWVFRYPGPDGKMNTPDDVVVDAQNSELHVPANKNVVIHITARETLHSFFVKELRLKQDAIPGRVISRWFNATETGKYEMACAEICGYGHFQMRNFLVVDSQEDYEKYITALYSGQEAATIAVATNEVGGNK